MLTSSAEENSASSAEDRRDDMERLLLIRLRDSRSDTDSLLPDAFLHHRRYWEFAIPDGDLESCVCSLIDFLANPDVPDRVVLVGVDRSALTVLEVADRHPERMAAAIAVFSEQSLVSSASLPELPCPTLALMSVSTGGVALTTVEEFLGTLSQPLGTSDACQTRLPPLTPALVHDPEAMRRRRYAGSLHRLESTDAATAWVITGHRAAASVMATTQVRAEVEITPGFRAQPAELAAAHRGSVDTISIHGVDHADIRKLIERYLTPQNVGCLEGRIQLTVDGLLQGLSDDREIDLVREFALPLPVLVLCELIGIPNPDYEYIQDWLLRRVHTPPPGAHSDIDAYLLGQIENKRNSVASDFITWVIEEEGDHLVEDDLVSAIRLLMVAGCRPTTTLLANGLAALLTHRDQWQMLTENPRSVGRAVEELLRFVTPYPLGIPRYATSLIDEEGVLVPEGNLVAASLVAANRDPDVFEDPDNLNINRVDNPHVAFGHGHHHCLGASLGRAQLRIVLQTLALRFPHLSLSPDARNLNYRKSSVRYLLELPVVLQPDVRRQSSSQRA
ncbi:cytochrome P450 [Streptomyces werraensis]|uniref:cytochrome P450 n=1 Tax=Streptomyces werraensis TaxID=68284 RepID=UPI001CE268DA